MRGQIASHAYNSFCSTESIRGVSCFQIAQHNCLLIKHTKDTRYSDIGVATHDKKVTRLKGFYWFPTLSLLIHVEVLYRGIFSSHCLDF